MKKFKQIFTLCYWGLCYKARLGYTCHGHPGECGGIPKVSSSPLKEE